MALQPSSGNSTGIGWGLPLAVGAVGVGAWLAVRALRTGYDFRDKVVLITGGSRGLGLVLARQLAREGAHLAICARDRAELDAAFDELAALGARVLAVPCDVGDRDDVLALVNAVQHRWDRVDVLINNAGTIMVGPEATMTLEDYELAMRTHFWGPLYATLAVLPNMKRRRQGRIVNISSIGGKVSVPHLLPYSASKFALVGLSEGLRGELSRDGIVVTTVCPGLMRTGSPRNAIFKGQHQAEYAWFSIGDSLPFFSMSAERAARQILTACRHGDAEAILSLPAKCLVALHGVFPGLTADLLGWVNRMLPGPGGIGQERALGKDSESGWAPSVLTTLSDWAARENNEVRPEEQEAVR